MSARLRKLAVDQVYETLTAIIFERTEPLVFPLPAEFTDSGRVMLVKWPRVGDRQLVVVVSWKDTTVFRLRRGRPDARHIVDPEVPYCSLISLIYDGWDWVQEGARE